MKRLEQNIQTELASAIGKLLREKFGKGPESIFVSCHKPFFTIYLRNFLSPMEQVLVDEKQEETVLKTRDILMKTLIPEIKAYIKIVTGTEIQEFYYDWSFHNKSGIFIGISADSKNENKNVDEYEGKKEIHREMISITQHVQKTPQEVQSYLLNPRTLVVVRKGILVAIEKELNRLGYQQILEIAKRNLEKRLLHNNNHFEELLNSKVIDIFLDWDYDKDKSVTVFILNPNK